MAPNKMMDPAQGVSIIDHGKVNKGKDFNFDGMSSLTAYRKLSDPQAQIIQ